MGGGALTQTFAYAAAAPSSSTTTPRYYVTGGVVGTGYPFYINFNSARPGIDLHAQPAPGLPLGQGPADDFTSLRSHGGQSGQSCLRSWRPKHQSKIPSPGVNPQRRMRQCRHGFQLAGHRQYERAPLFCPQRRIA
ncbi:MAG: hypothetical protein M5U34_16100 [Chloroflexi bacterium]|nr:hypothetical protein [Chloroflexota bacterium]